jgi:hypothetical protein
MAAAAKIREQAENKRVRNPQGMIFIAPSFVLFLFVVVLFAVGSRNARDTNSDASSLA